MSAAKMNEKIEEHHTACISEEREETCWGCGLRLMLTSYSPVFKCGWCGAITNKKQTSRKADSACFSRWRCFRDRFFVSVLLFFMLFVICAGVWAVYPVVFSKGLSFGVLHCIITAILSVCTIGSFCLASFRSAGEPKPVVWGSYPVVGKGALENYTYCTYCAKPKSPRAHHCRSCKMCILDMDHHCPFIGNCVGAGNHHSFIVLLISVIISCVYVIVMAFYAGYQVWPPLEYGTHAISIFHSPAATLKLLTAAIARSLMLLSPQGLILVYLAFATIAVVGGVSALLWQQLYYIYEGNTYINSISLQNEVHGEKGCQNLLRFFGCPYSFFRFFPGLAHAAKFQEVSYSKLL